MILESVYGLGRVAFGAALIAAPAPFGNVLIGSGARKGTARMLFRFYGTRDLVVGLGMLRAASRGDARGWLAAAITSDALDAAVMLTEWDEIPPEKRVPGLLAALSAGAVGVALLARSRQSPDQ